MYCRPSVNPRIWTTGEVGASRASPGRSRVDTVTRAPGSIPGNVTPSTTTRPVGRWTASRARSHPALHRPWVAHPATRWVGSRSRAPAEGRGVDRRATRPRDRAGSTAPPWRLAHRPTAEPRPSINYRSATRRVGGRSHRGRARRGADQRPAGGGVDAGDWLPSAAMAAGPDALGGGLAGALSRAATPGRQGSPRSRTPAPPARDSHRCAGAGPDARARSDRLRPARCLVRDPRRPRRPSAIPSGQTWS